MGMSETPESEEPSYEITGAIAGPKDGIDGIGGLVKKAIAGPIVRVAGGVALAGVVTVFSLRKKGKGSAKSADTDAE